MKKWTSLLVITFFNAVLVMAQDSQILENSGLQISGSVDTYWKYDFSGYTNEDGSSNIQTSFADNQNSISIGMLDIVLSQSIGKASFVGEVSFGPRSWKSIPTFQIDSADQININIQNLLVSYAISDKVSMTAGYMGTFVGYEVISPTGNFNYSTSYLFSFGPFQNSGLKLDWAVSDKLALMIGVFNDWNVYQDFNGVSDIGGQIHFSPSEGADIYLNFLSGDPSGTVIDLTAGWQLNNKFYLGLNAADYSAPEVGGYTGAAIYPQYSISDAFAVGLRSEYFKSKGYTENLVQVDSENVIANTITGNFYTGPLTVITELRIDNTSVDTFVDGSNNPVDTASQFLIAAIYAF